VGVRQPKRGLWPAAKFSALLRSEEKLTHLPARGQSVKELDFATVEGDSFARSRFKQVNAIRRGDRLHIRTGKDLQ
jgi:hypothetical protein